MRYGLMTGVACTAVVFLSAGPGFAQAPGGRPYRGVFGSGPGNVAQSLTVRGSIGSGFDDHVLSDGEVMTPEDAGAAEQFGGVPLDGSVGLTYLVSTARLSVNATVSSSARYQRELSETLVGSHNATVSGGVALTPRTRLSLGTAARYEPVYGLDLFSTPRVPGAGQTLPADYRLGVARDRYLSLTHSVGLSQQLSQRASITLTYGRSRGDFPGTDSDQSSELAQGRITYALGRGLGVRVGYGRQVGSYQAEGLSRVVSQTIDGGIDFHKALSFSRSTSLSVSTGSAILSDGDARQFHFTGQARLDHQIGRSWSTALEYKRDMQYLHTLRLPALVDAIGADLGGLLGRRVNLHGSVEMAMGEQHMAERVHEFRTYQGAAGVTFGLTRFIGFSVDYSYYRHRFDSSIALPVGMLRNVDRQSVRATVNVSALLFSRVRR